MKSLHLDVELGVLWPWLFRIHLFLQVSTEALLFSSDYSYVVEAFSIRILTLL